VQFTVDTNFTTARQGHIRLDWKGVKNAKYELQRALKSDFTDPVMLYRGPDQASFISGMDDGVYYFRVRETEGVWSEVLTVQVAHQSLRLAFILFGIGGIVFLFTVIVVVNGARRYATDYS
jgi:hypothetical protein